MGLVPLDAMVESGKWYIGEGHSEEAYIEAAIEHLGLNSIGPFNPRERIIEWAIQEERSDLGYEDVERISRCISE